MGVEKGEVLFVANHAFNCLRPKAGGMCSAFIDRNLPFGGTPHQRDIRVKDMLSLADLIGCVGKTEYLLECPEALVAVPLTFEKRLVHGGVPSIHMDSFFSGRNYPKVVLYSG